MTIHSLETRRIRIPLMRPFVTAIRRVSVMEAVQVLLRCTEGCLGYGEAPSSALITGDTLPSIEEAINGYIAPALLGRSLDEDLGSLIDAAIRGNTSAKAAVEIALMDLQARRLSVPLYEMLGANRKSKKPLTTDMTISLGPTEVMIKDALAAIAGGFSVLKIKTGARPDSDAEQLIKLWHGLAGQDILLRVDANQGWSPDEAIAIIHAWEDAGIPIDIIEQPVPAWDIEGLAKVSAHSRLPIAADEAVFSPRDALRVIESRAAGVINIKLMKSGGIGPALEICELCRIHGLECMIGCMLEGEISAAAAAHLAASSPIITRLDIDSPLMYQSSEYMGGTAFEGPNIILNDSPGLGVQ